MALITKKIKDKQYYYSFLSYSLVGKSKSFSRYIGTHKPTEKELEILEDNFKSTLISKLSGKTYRSELLDKDNVIKTLLFRDLFNKRYGELSKANRQKYDTDSTILFTLTTLTTEEVDVSLSDIKSAFQKISHLTQKELIGKNMLKAVELIKGAHILDKAFLLELHKTIMASFETKYPGQLRERQVYLYRRDKENKSRELAYRPPEHNTIDKLLDEFIGWYSESKLNPIEKATIAHYKLYKLHPFLDGNKRICRLIFNKTLIDEGFPLLNVSVEKEYYFEALINSVEKDQAKILVDFILKQYYKQVRGFVVGPNISR